MDGRMESAIDDWDEIEVPAPNKVKRQPKLAPWREAERYFKRYRDKEKTIPLRPRTDGKVNP